MARERAKRVKQTQEPAPTPRDEWPETLSDPPEQQLLQEVVSVPCGAATLEPPTTSAGEQPLKQWRVSMPHGKELTVWAADRAGAVKEYFRQRNIVRTRHLVTVVEA